MVDYCESANTCLGCSLFDDVLSAIVLLCIIQERAELLVCKLPGCNKPFKSSKTLRRHVVQKHSDNARFLVCNQPTVNGVMCRFETIHSGVLSYHRKHSLAHQRREDWHISCPFCQSKFARQHEMDRHQRICKSRPVPQLCNEFQTLNGSLSEGLDVSDQLQSFRMPSHSHLQHQQHLHIPESNESGIAASRLMIPGGHLLETDSASTTLFWNHMTTWTIPHRYLWLYIHYDNPHKFTWPGCRLPRNLPHAHCASNACCIIQAIVISWWGFLSEGGEGNNHVSSSLLFWLQASSSFADS